MGVIFSISVSLRTAYPIPESPEILFIFPYIPAFPHPTPYEPHDFLASTPMFKSYIILQKTS